MQIREFYRDAYVDWDLLEDRTNAAVKSSATAEDLTDASFAGQKDLSIGLK